VAAGVFVLAVLAALAVFALLAVLAVLAVLVAVLVAVLLVFAVLALLADGRSKASAGGSQYAGEIVNSFWQCMSMGRPWMLAG
jgi:uncharacterized membrane protein